MADWRQYQEADAAWFRRLSPEKGTTTYHLRATGVTVGEWDDGRPRLDLTTEVVCGEFEGFRGPRITLSHGPLVKDGEERVTEEQSRARLVQTLTIINTDIDLGDGGFDAEMYMLASKQLVGKSFYARVGRDPNNDNFDRVRMPLYALGNPPRNFACACAVTAY